MPFDNKSSTECIQTVSDMDTQIRLDKIRLDKNRDSSSTPVDAQPLFDYQSVIDSFNSVCVSLPKVLKLTEKRRKAIKNAKRQEGSDLNDYQPTAGISAFKG